MNGICVCKKIECAFEIILFILIIIQQADTARIAAAGFTFKRYMYKKLMNCSCTLQYRHCGWIFNTMQRMWPCILVLSSPLASIRRNENSTCWFAPPMIYLLKFALYMIPTFQITIFGGNQFLFKMQTPNRHRRIYYLLEIDIYVYIYISHIYVLYHKTKCGRQ